MAGHKLITDLDSELAYKIARKAAKGLDFAVTSLGDGAFAAQKGNLAMSIILGAFIAYCDFKVMVEDDDDRTLIEIERNAPWWTGFIGVNRVKTRAKELKDDIVRRIEDEGGAILKDKDV